MRKDNITRNSIISLLGVYGKMTISELAKRLRVSRPTVYLHLEVLEKKGLIKREKDPKKKGAPVTVTPVEKEVSKQNKQDLLEFLQTLQQKGDTDIHDMSKLGISIISPAYLEASIRGYTSKKIYLTDKGKQFLKENSK